jgi:hypothetical protein
MIERGHLVQDWMGRAGITLRPCDPPGNESEDGSLAGLRRRGGTTSPWWVIALFSGAVVRSPERVTYSWGPTNKVVLEWAMRRVDEASGQELALLLDADEAEPRPGVMHP